MSERQQTQIKLFILISRKCGHEAQTSIYVEFSMANGRLERASQWTAGKVRVERHGRVDIEL